jgi:hypothetical protein
MNTSKRLLPLCLFPARALLALPATSTVAFSKSSAVPTYTASHSGATLVKAARTSSRSAMPITRSL